MKKSVYLPRKTFNFMDTISGINVNFSAKGPLFCPLSSASGILVVEFDCDLKPYVLPYHNTSPRKEIEGLIHKIARFNTPEHLILRSALRRSKTLSVNVETAGDYDEDTLLALKYEAIRKYKAHYPSGYNLLFGKRFPTTKEASMALAMLKEVLFTSQDPTEQNLLRPVGRPSRAVFMMTESGDPIRSFSSAKEASEVTGLSVSAISKCCRGDLASAGGYLWTYDASFYNAKPAVE